MKPALTRMLWPCVGLTALAGCGKDDPPKDPPPPQVSTVKAELQSVPLTRDLVGRLSPYYSANIVARVSGVLVKRAYQEGSEVKQGQLLFEIDPTYYQTVLNSNLATLAQDQATYINNRVSAERNRKLLPIGSVSQQTLDDAEATERSAAARVKADEAAVAAARINLGYTRVRAPISGIAGQQQVTQGALVGSTTNDSGSGGTLLTTVEQVDRLYVNFTLSAADLVTLRQAQNVALAQPSETKVQIALPNGSQYDQLGTLDFSDVAVNAATDAVNLRALVPNLKHQLLPGMYVTLKVTLGQQSNVFLIPQQALQRDTAGAYALVVDQDGTVVRKKVDTSESYRTSWIVTNGLAAGDQVIVSGLQRVHEGGNAKAVPWQSPEQVATLSPPHAPGASADPATGGNR
jgi:membrane fusion protein (multidrug efflux system)